MSANDQFQDRLYTEEVSNLDGVLMNNRVMIEVEGFLYDTVKTKSGLELAVDNTEVVTDYIIRHGIVFKVPSRLIFWDEEAWGIGWKTEIEIQAGDVVWFYSMMAHAAEKISFKGRKFLLLSYEDLYVAKRGEKIICLNGTVMLRPRYTTLKALSFEKKELNPKLADIAYIGSTNTEYEQEYREDDPDLKAGMEVTLSGRPFRWLEKKPYLFFDGQEYAVVQNHEIKSYLTEL